MAGPFGEIVEAPAVKKRIVKVAEKVKRTSISRALKPAVAAPTAENDPFAELASSPVEKTSISLKAKSVKPKTAAVKKVKPEPTSKLTSPAAKPRLAGKAVTAKTKVVSAKARTTKKALAAPSIDATAEIAAALPEVAVSPAFKALADVALPKRKRENRARLQVQTPTRVNLYWSLKENPWVILRDAFGAEIGSYTLVIKLRDLTRNTEQIHREEAEGSRWFDVEANSEYEAEVGFYAPNRPYFRVIYSNTVSTPRRSPSTRPASEARWTMTANTFAEVLDVAGFTRDAIDVAMAGDNPAAAHLTAHTAFASLAGTSIDHLYDIPAEDLRHAMLSVAAGRSVNELRASVSPALFTIMQSTSASLSKPRAIEILSEHFDVDGSEFAEEQLGPVVYGASLMNFPKTLRPRFSPSRYNPVSSNVMRF